jgi:signal peptidase I
MARQQIERMASDYYPPRARWYSRSLYPFDAVRRALALEKLCLPDGASVGQFVLCLALPGYAFCALGRKRSGCLVFGGYCVALIVFIVAFGYAAASISFALMISAHATSIVFLQGAWLRSPREILSDAPSGGGQRVISRGEHCRFRFRLTLAFATVVCLAVTVYWPLMSLTGRWVVPVRTSEGVYVISRAAMPESIARGDWVACQISGGSGIGDVIVRRGVFLNRVIALPGDRIEFAPGAFHVNGVEHRSLPHMPASGSYEVGKNHWFIWPDMAMTGANPVAAQVSATLLREAMVPADRLIGKPIKWWFWRQQRPGIQS